MSRRDWEEAEEDEARSLLYSGLKRGWHRLACAGYLNAVTTVIRASIAPASPIASVFFRGVSVASTRTTMGTFARRDKLHDVSDSVSPSRIPSPLSSGSLTWRNKMESSGICYKSVFNLNKNQSNNEFSRYLCLDNHTNFHFILYLDPIYDTLYLRSKWTLNLN